MVSPGRQLGDHWDEDTDSSQRGEHRRLVTVSGQQPVDCCDVLGWGSTVVVVEVMQRVPVTTQVATFPGLPGGIGGITGEGGGNVRREVPFAHTRGAGWPAMSSACGKVNAPA